MAEDLPPKTTLRGLLARHREDGAKVARLMLSAAATRLGMFGMVLVVTRQLGPSDFGWFVFTLGAAALAGMAGAMGWPLSFNRFFAKYRHDDDLARMHGLMRASMRGVLTGAVVVSLSLIVAGALIPEFSKGLIGGAILALPYALMMLRRQQLAGTGRAPTALLLDEGFASIVLLVAVLLFRLELAAMLAIYFAAMVSGNIVATRLVSHKLPPLMGLAAPMYETSAWMRSSVSLLVVQSARIVLSRLDVLLVPTLASLAAAGIYGAAFRTTHLVTFPQFVLQTITWPLFAEAFAQGNVARARKILLATFGFALVTMLPVVVVILAVPEWFMRTFFGPEYVAGADALVYLTLGQFLLGASFPFAGVLAMGARETVFGALNLAVMAATFALAFFIIPGNGATGGAVVFLAATTALLVGQVALSLRPLKLVGAGA